MKWLALVVAAALLAAAGAPVQAQNIGVASIVKNKVTGKLGLKVRNLRRGNGIFHREDIATAQRSMTRLTFLDRTRLTVGANSRVRLSTYVYDPRRRTGKITVNAVKGAFRFVSGVARPSSYHIRTAMAYTGIRGTVIDGYVDPRRRFDLLILRRGAMQVCGPSRCVNASRPGTYVLVKSNGNVATGRWTGALQPLIRKHMYGLYPGVNSLAARAAVRDFNTSFRTIR